MGLKLFFILLLFTFSAKAQRQGKELADSLIAALPYATNDTIKARALNRISLFYANTNTDTALKYAAIGMQVAKKMNWKKGIGAFHTCYGNIYGVKGMYDLSMEHIQEALKISIELKDTVNIGSAYNNLGSTAFSKGDYLNAIKNYMLCLKNAEQTKNIYLTGLAQENIGNVYYYQQNYSQALDYGYKSLSLRRKDKINEEMVISSLQLIGLAYKGLRQYDSSLHYFDSTLVLNKMVKNKTNEGMSLMNIADVHALKKDFTKAITYAIEAKGIWDELEPNFESALENEGALGSYYLQMAKIIDSQKMVSTATIPNNKLALLQLSKKYLEHSLQKGQLQKNQSIYSTLLGSLAETNFLLGDYKNAYTNYRKFIETHDSIYSQENKNKIAAATSQLEIDKKNSEIALQNLTINNQKKQKIFFIGGLLLLGIIGGLLFYQNRTRKKTNTTLMVLNNQLDDANKVKAKFFGILSHDLRSPISNLVNFLHLQKNEPGLFTADQATAHEKKIVSSAESLLETMEAMLLWSKGQMENFKPEIKSVAVNDLYSYLEKFFATTENVQLTFNNPQNVLVTTDENYLQTIMHNLTANAIKALKNTPNATILWNVVQEQDKISLSITDNGPGLNTEQSEALYEDAIITSSKTGLGLHIIRDLAKAIQCKIKVQSKPGIGTTFILTV